MPTIRDFALSIANRARAKAIRASAKEYAYLLKQIKAEDVVVLIGANRPLRDILPRRVVIHPLARRVLETDPEVLLEVLEEYNPQLARVLSTPEGRKWWGINNGHPRANSV